MKVNDSIGNELHEGSIVFWKQIGAVCHIADIHAPEGAKEGELSLVIKVPFQAAKPETFLRDFIAVVNPKQTQAVVEMMKGASAG